MMMGESIVLVITPSPYLTKKIQKALDDLGNYNVITCSSPAVALDFTRKTAFHICILDVFHPEFPMRAIVKEMRNYLPELRLVLIMTDHNLLHEDIPEIAPDGILPRSFIFSQFKTVLESLSPPAKLVDTTVQPTNLIPTISPVEQRSNFAILGDFPRLSKPADYTELIQRISTLTIDTRIQAILIIRRKQLLAHKDRLPPSSIQEILDLINSNSKTSARYLNKEIIPGNQKSSSGNLIRFIQLQPLQSKLLLYMLSLTKEMSLAAVFEPDTQFSDIRQQTLQIAHELLGPDWKTPLEYPSQHPPIVEDAQTQTTPSVQSGMDSAGLLDHPVLEKPGIQAETIWDPTSAPLSVKVQSPTPDTEQTGENSFSDFGQTTAEMQGAGDKITHHRSGTGVGYHESDELDDQVVGEPFEFRQQEKENAAPSATGQEAIPASPASSFRSYISYSCMLIPRLPQHLLTGNLVAYLFKWAGQVCLAYGWRLEHLSIHPDHIHMIAGAPLTTSPAFLVRTLRQSTSQSIFTQFPPLTAENPSGDFWAPGFFITSGKQAIQPQLVEEYVKEIRENQGVNHTIYS